MDGLQTRLSDSIQFKLSVTLSVAILLVALAAGTFSFMTAFEEAHELQDDTLKQVAALVQRQHVTLSQMDATLSEEGSRIIVQALPEAPEDGKLAAAAPGALPLPPGLPAGLHTLALKGQTYRVLVGRTASGQGLAVAQETGVRDEIARDSALHTALPLLFLVPILLLMVAQLVRQSFRPIGSLAAEVDQREEDDLHPMNDLHLPREVRPFVLAINRLLARVAQEMAAQRRFVADAAHELRSPLTALSLQAERLAQTALPEPAQARLSALRQGIERSRHLLTQLLTLARVQANVPDAAPQALSVHALFRQALADLMPLAEARQIDLGIQGASDAQVLVDGVALSVVLKNLVDNAIRYTPPGGRVDLSVTLTPDAVHLCVDDTGPGIPPAERARVFDPFYRVLGQAAEGSGLGLSIVKRLTDRMGARLSLSEADAQRNSGLRVCVVVPCAPQAQAKRTRPDTP